MTARLLESLDALITQAPRLTGLWVVFVGGCIGSFMNVVVYRLPAGMSLLHPGSRCPVCGHGIRWYDNLPVIGWLRLKGRCRDCQTQISARYPAIEALVMVLFAHFWLQDVTGSAAEQRLDFGLFCFGWHVSLLCMLICVALIDFDGHKIPQSLLVFGVAVPLAMTFGWRSYAAELLNVVEVLQIWGQLFGGAVLASLATLIFKPAFPVWRPGTVSREVQSWTPLTLSAISGLYLGPGRGFLALLATALLWRGIRLLRGQRHSPAPWSWYLAAMCWFVFSSPTQ